MSASFETNLRSATVQGDLDNISTASSNKFTEIYTAKGAFNFKTSSLNVIHSNEIVLQYTSTSSQYLAFSQSTSIDIRVDRLVHGIIHDVTLQFQLTNTDTKVLRMSPVPYWLNYMEIWSNDGSYTTCRHYAEHEAICNSIFYTTEQWDHYQQTINSDDNLNPSWVMQAGEVRIFYLRLKDIWLAQIKSCLEGLTGVSIFRLYFASFAQINEPVSVNPATVSPTMNFVSLFLGVTDRLEGELESYTKLMKSPSGADFIVTMPGQLHFSQVMNASTTTQFQLTSLYGKIPIIFFMIRSSSPNGRARRRGFPINYYELVDATGQNLLGGQIIPSDYVRFLQWPDNYPSNMLLGATDGLSIDANIHFITHSSNPMAAMTGNGMTGYFEYNGNQILKITTPAVTAAVNEVQTITTRLSGTSVATAPTAGSFSLSFMGRTTQPLAFGATANTIQGALEYLPTIGIGNVTVVGTTATTIAITFVNDMAAMPISGGQIGVTGIVELCNSSLVEATPLRIIGTTVITTAGVWPGTNAGKLNLGWPSGTGTLYDVDLYYWFYARLHIANGQISINSL